MMKQERYLVCVKIIDKVFNIFVDNDRISDLNTEYERS
jgi:hypothetical protein